MKYNHKISGFTLSEMLVVMILTSVVVGLAFMALTLVQKHMLSIQTIFNDRTELNLLEQSLWLDFNRYSNVVYDSKDNSLQFSSEIDTINYVFKESMIVKQMDTFNIQPTNKIFYFNGDTIEEGVIDAFKLETSKTLNDGQLFIYKINDANTFMK